jgi:hypothetical protein
MKLKALGYFVRKFEAQPAEEYLRRTDFDNLLSMVVSNILWFLRWLDR